jgi:hypothetical protein
VGLAVGKGRGTSTVNATDPSGQAINAIQAAPATCLATLPEGSTVARVTAVPCTTPHRAEVVSSYAVSGDAWPGADTVNSEVMGHCASFIQPGFAASSMFKSSDWDDGLRWVAWLPTEASWAANERTGVCVAYRDGDIVGSFVAGTATFVN